MSHFQYKFNFNKSTNNYLKYSTNHQDMIQRTKNPKLAFDYLQWFQNAQNNLSNDILLKEMLQEFLSFHIKAPQTINLKLEYFDFCFQIILDIFFNSPNNSKELRKKSFHILMFLLNFNINFKKFFIHLGVITKLEKYLENDDTQMVDQCMQIISSLSNTPAAIPHLISIFNNNALIKLVFFGNQSTTLSLCHTMFNIVNYQKLTIMQIHSYILFSCKVITMNIKNDIILTKVFEIILNMIIKNPDIEISFLMLDTVNIENTSISLIEFFLRVIQNNNNSELTVLSLKIFNQMLKLHFMKFIHFQEIQISFLSILFDFFICDNSKIQKYSIKCFYFYYLNYINMISFLHQSILNSQNNIWTTNTEFLPTLLDFMKKLVDAIIPILFQIVGQVGPFNIKKYAILLIDIIYSENNIQMQIWSLLHGNLNFQNYNLMTYCDDIFIDSIELLLQSELGTNTQCLTAILHICKYIINCEKNTPDLFRKHYTPKISQIYEELNAFITLN